MRVFGISTRTHQWLRVSVVVCLTTAAVAATLAQCPSAIAQHDASGVLTQANLLPSGSGFVAGWTPSQQGDKDVIVFRQFPDWEYPCGPCHYPVDPSRCRRCHTPWTITIPIPQSDEVPVQVLTHHEDEAVIIAQEYRNGQPSGIVTIKVVVSGGQLVQAWRRQVGLPQMLWRDAALLPNGEILIASSYRGATGKDWFLIQYAGNGTVLNQVPIDGGFGDDEPTSVVVTNTGEAYIGGYLTRESGAPEGVVYRHRGGYFVYRSPHPDASYILKMAAGSGGSAIGIGAKRGTNGFDPFVVTLRAPTAAPTETEKGWIRRLSGGGAGDYHVIDFALVPVPNTDRHHLLMAVLHVPPLLTNRPNRIFVAQEAWQRLSDGTLQPVRSVQHLFGVPGGALPVSLQLVPRSSGGFDWAILSLRPLEDNPSYAGRSVSFGSWNPDTGIVLYRRGPYFGYFVYLVPPVDIPSVFQENRVRVYRGGYFVYRAPTEPSQPGSSGEAILYGTRTPNQPRMEAMFITAPPREDVNLDCCIDDADLLAVLFAFGRSGELLEDTNLDGVVDDADLLSVLFSFGRGC